MKQTFHKNKNACPRSYGWARTKKTEQLLGLSKCIVVGLRGFKLNAQLAHYLRKTHTAPDQFPASVSAYRARQWHVRDRLNMQKIADIVRAFKAGTAKPVLAQRYRINLRSLKKLLREEGVKRKSWNDIQP